jgi:hypothetical protein
VALVRTDVGISLQHARQLLVTASVVPSSPIRVTPLKVAISTTDTRS